ncbi:unnamed protein product [Effrenium voratum]|uniref:Uncharacterized protein n=1 Tax=Effrenium voratum TaxID=2562239 RepID=A0AA36IGH1_9DINO|nr:unnamed protein product [Effrenium voratum]
MLANRIALLEYDVPGPQVIHERMVIEHVGGDDYGRLQPSMMKEGDWRSKRGPNVEVPRGGLLRRPEEPWPRDLLLRRQTRFQLAQEHFQLSMMLRQLLQVDSINGCNSLGVELMFRRLQTIEYAHSEKARENESRLSGGKLALEEQYVFGSVVRHAGTLMIAPSLLSHVKEETEKEVLLAKNLRKAKEERELAAKKGGKKNAKNEEGLQKSIFGGQCLQNCSTEAGETAARESDGGGALEQLRAFDGYGDDQMPLLEADLVEVVKEKWAEKIEIFFVAKKATAVQWAANAEGISHNQQTVLQEGPFFLLGPTYLLFMVIHRQIPMPQLAPDHRKREAKKVRKKKEAPGQQPALNLEKQAKRQQQLEQVGSLANASVGPVALSRYQAMRERLQTSAGQTINARVSAKRMDQMLCNCLHEMFLEGEGFSSAQYVVAAALFFCPHLRSPRQMMLPMTKQCLQGWRKLDPPLSRLPLPHEVVCLMAEHSIKKSKIEEGLMMHLAMEAYLRPGELNKIRVGDVVPPVAGSKKPQWSLVLHPTEEGQMSKAQEFDETIIFDLDEQPALLEAIYRVMRLAFRNPQEKVFSVKFEEVMRRMEEACQAHNMTCLGPPHAYRLRHAGASRDFLLKARNMADIQQRGRWKAPSSTRRYQKGGRLQQMLHQLPKAARDAALRASQRRVALLRSLR